MQNTWVKLLHIIEFTYNNAKSISVETSILEMNFWLKLKVLFKENVDAKSKSKSAETLRQELKNRPVDHRRNLQIAKDLEAEVCNTFITLRMHLPAIQV